MRPRLPEFVESGTVCTVIVLFVIVCRMKSSKKMPNLKPQICDIGNGRAESLRRWILSIPRKSMKTCENHLRVMWWAFLFIKCRQAEVPLKPLKHLLLTRHTVLQYTTHDSASPLKAGRRGLKHSKAISSCHPLGHRQELQRCHYIARSWVGLELRSCHHHNLPCPRWPQICLPGWQQRHAPWHGFVGHPSVDLGLRSSHHHNLPCPTWPQIHLPKWRQMHPNCPEPAAHSWVDLGLWSCYHHVLGHPKYITTDPSLRLAANARPPNQICCTALSWSWIAELSPPQLGLP